MNGLLEILSKIRMDWNDLNDWSVKFVCTCTGSIFVVRSFLSALQMHGD